MATLHTILRHAALRHLANRALRLGGCGVAIGCGISLVILAVDRLGLASVPGVMFLIPPMVGLIAGSVVAWLTRPGPQDLAVLLDRSLSLKDRLGTAHAIDRRSIRNLSDESSAFAELVQRDVLRLTDTLAVRDATPIKITCVWITSVALALAAWLGFVYTPTVPLFDRSTAQEISHDDRIAQQEQARQAAAVVERAVQDLPRDASADPELAKELEAIDRLAEQMADSSSPDAAERSRQEAAARLAEVADRLAEQSRRDQAAAAQLAERFAGMNARDDAAPNPAGREFEEALRRGDFAQAAKTLDDLLQGANEMSAEERRKLAESLRDSASALQDAPPESEAALANQRELLEQALADHGLDHASIDELLNDEAPSREEVERMLHERQVNDEMVSRLAEEIEKFANQQQSREQSQRDAGEIAQSLEDAADQIERPPSDQTQPNEPAQDPQASRGDQSTERRPPGEQGDSSESQTRDPAQDSGSDQPQTAPDSTAQPRSQDEQSQQPSQTREQANSADQQQQRQDSTSNDREQGQPQAEQQQNQQQQQQEQPQPAQTQPGQPQQTPQTQPQPGASQQQPQPQNATEPQNQSQQREGEPTRDQSDASQQPQPTPGQPPDATQTPVPQPSPDQQDPNAAEQPGQSSDELPKPSDSLRKLAERLRDAKDQQQTIERLRETARDLARNMTPEQREQWARQWQKEMGENQPPDSLKNALAELQRSTGDGGNPAGDGETPNRASDPSRPLQSTTTEDVDLRGAEPGDQVLAKWLGEAQETPDGKVTSGGASKRVIEAQKAAERAVDDAAVPSRYHTFIKRVFGKLDETTRSASGDSSSAPGGGGK